MITTNHKETEMKTQHIYALTAAAGLILGTGGVIATAQPAEAITYCPLIVNGKKPSKANQISYKITTATAYGTLKLTSSYGRDTQIGTTSIRFNKKQKMVSKVVGGRIVWCPVGNATYTRQATTINLRPGYTQVGPATVSTASYTITPRWMIAVKARIRNGTVLTGAGICSGG